MRNIRIFLILFAAMMVIFPKVASANETNNTETNTNSTFQYFSQLVDAENIETKMILQIIEKQNSQLPEDDKYKTIISLWKDKQADKWGKLSKQPFAINASAYTAAADECGNSKGITASGVKVQENRTIACPPEFPFGVKIKIGEMGTFVCEDRGGAIKGNHIDIYVKTKDQAFAFGRQNLMAQVVE